MHVTELIKYKEYKDYLISRFPKPKYNFREVSQSANTNPSLTGNAFETLFRLSITTKNKLKKEFNNNFLQAEKNILSIKRRATSAPRTGDEDILYLQLSREDYQNKIPTIKKILSGTPYLTNGKKQKIKAITVKNLVLDFKLLGDIYEATDLLLYPSIDKENIIYDVESLADYYKIILKDFETQSLQFIKDKALTRRFAKTILLFTHISHPFFTGCTPLKNLEFEPVYFSFIYKHFKAFCKNFQGIKGKLIGKPSLAFHSILATPDFMVRNKLLEIKTSKKFHNKDYLQALSYLIFAQYPENKKFYGTIQSIGIYYSLFNKEVEIKLDDLKLSSTDLRIIKSIVTKFKKDYFTIEYRIGKTEKYKY